MTKNKMIYGLLIFFVVSVSSFSQQGKFDITTQLENKIDSMRITFDFPAVAYGVIRNDSIIALNVFGYRDIETTS